MSVVIEDDIPDDFEPSEEEIHEYAKWLGMDLAKDQHLLWIARYVRMLRADPGHPTHYNSLISLAAGAGVVLSLLARTHAGRSTLRLCACAPANGQGRDQGAAAGGLEAVQELVWRHLLLQLQDRRQPVGAPPGRLLQGAVPYRTGKVAVAAC